MQLNRASGSTHRWRSFGAQTTAELALQLADVMFHLAHKAIADHVVIAGHCDAASFEHQSRPTIQQIGRYSIAARHGRYASAALSVSSTILSFSAGGLHL